MPKAVHRRKKEMAETIRVQISAPFEVPGQDTAGWVQLPAGSRVSDLLRLARPPLALRLLPVVVNGKTAGRRHVLQDGDRVVFLLPMSGG
uniref:MoaD/ThiS family protein n=1 Tax=Bellilinea caldifistulae TaxID=360411 RepID=A0A7C4KXP1_9CHLR